MQILLGILARIFGRENSTSCVAFEDIAIEIRCAHTGVHSIALNGSAVLGIVFASEDKNKF
jgi:hypothetical protein